MLERFESVKKIGLFENYIHSPGCELGGVTIIYGENGVGKSTLAAVLDSLRERNAREIIRRRSLPGDVAPTAAVRMNGKLYTFDGRDWDDQLPYATLEVFFPGFVTRNVHAATGVDPMNRRNLCEFVLGRIAIEKVRRLAAADNESREALAAKKAIEKQLEMMVKKPDTLETFVALANDEKIDEKMENARAELKQAQSKDAILARAVAKAVALPMVDREGVVRFLEKSSDCIGGSFAALVREHITLHLNNEGERWLAYGAKHIGTDNKCPFCAQDLAGSSLVAAVRSYFSEEYRTYTEALSVEIQSIRGLLGTAAFAKLRSAFTVQFALAALWADEMPIDQPDIASSLADAEATWVTAEAKLEAILEIKQAKPLEKMEPVLAEDALADYERTLAKLMKLNEILSASGKKAEERKAALSGADTAEIEQRLRRLENQKLRFEPVAKNLLETRNALIEKRNKLAEEKTVLKKDIDENSARVVGKYQDGINHYLEQFSCDIKIDAVEPEYPSGKAIVHYKLKAHGHEFELGLSETEPCFETVLSEGDKNTLALSFFFARLKDQSDLTKRVVVLDDPVNSLGSFRRTLIEGVIRDLRVRGAQVVVLTHDELLAAMMCRDKKLKDIVSLQVERTRSGSQIKPWDVERATQSEYVEQYLTLVEYLEKGGDHKRAAGCIRPYLEQRLRHLFPGPPFQTRDTLGEMISKIRKSMPGERLHVLLPQLPELESINEAALPSHHATDDPGMQPLSPEAVRLFAEKTLKVL